MDNRKSTKGLTPRQFAVAVGLSKWAVYRAIHAGKVKVTNPTGPYRICPSEVDAFTRPMRRKQRRRGRRHGA